jgi:hypothetical protein
LCLTIRREQSGSPETSPSAAAVRRSAPGWKLMQTSVSKLGVILASGSEDDRNCLEAILDGTRWMLVDARGPEIREVLRGASVPIVFDVDDRSECWRERIRAFRKMRRDVRVILMSSDNDAPPSDEVARWGGFDVLTRPVRREHVLPMLLFAYACCRGHGSYLSRPRRMSPSAVI